ncbi:MULTISPECIES: AAA family ATPase [Oceanobacillus]|uniref:UvrD-like helicase C-terminal domain-containing protein n=1 Tax=Oceanobacillus kimchii TaxID=746691 RepID=A0ABQ5TT90_9BACI|nr:AAA family ATPase [Oceanobacillus kimchii]GLO68337.1 hypothetical protein MACH08_41210 [Oceanobacillus kimchii]
MIKSIEKETLQEEIFNSSRLPRDHTHEMMQQNIYRTILYGVPFRLADEFAHATKEFQYNDSRRIVGAMCNVYMNKLSHGNTTLYDLNDKVRKINGRSVITSKGSFRELVSKTLSQSNDLFQEQSKLWEWYEDKEGKVHPRLDKNYFYTALEQMNDIKLHNRKLFDFSEYNGRYSLYHLPTYWSEYQLAKRILEIIHGKSILKTSKDVAKLKAINYGADTEQALAISEVFDNKVSIITGGAGTGKSKTIEILANVLLDENANLSIRVCSPTGIAAQNLQNRFMTSPSENVRSYFSDSVNKCRTIHSLLEVKPSKSIGMIRSKYSYKKDPLIADVLIIDEAGMVDIYLMRSLLWALKDYVHVVIVGDSNQLNSVGPGKILYDLTHSLKRLQEKVFVTPLPKWSKLNLIHRTEDDSRIPFLANTLLTPNRDERWNYFNQEMERCIEKGDVRYIQAKETKDILNLTVNEYLNDHSSVENVALITTRHEQTVGRNILNEKIQNNLMKRIGLEEGVIIIQNRNDYQHGVFNGEKGKITKVIENKITAEFTGERTISLYKNQAENDWLIGYAITVHKSQGTEAETVLLPIWNEPKSKIWNRSLLYTAITRSKKKLIIVGNNDALEQGVKNKEGSRLTRLPLFFREIAKRYMQNKLRF